MAGCSWSNKSSIYGSWYRFSIVILLKETIEMNKRRKKASLHKAKLHLKVPPIEDELAHKALPHEAKSTLKAPPHKVESAHKALHKAKRIIKVPPCKVGSAHSIQPCKALKPQC